MYKTDADFQRELVEMQHLEERGEFGVWRKEALANMDDLIDPSKIEQGWRSRTLRETYQPDDIVYDMLRWGSCPKTGSLLKLRGAGSRLRGTRARLTWIMLTRVQFRNRTREVVGNSGINAQT